MLISRFGGHFDPLTRGYSCVATTVKTRCISITPEGSLVAPHVGAATTNPPLSQLGPSVHPQVSVWTVPFLVSRELALLGHSMRREFPLAVPEPISSAT